MERAAFVAAPAYDDYVATDAEARRIAAEPDSVIAPELIS